jgi:DNA-binding beta-propeller fold protein YncE
MRTPLVAAVLALLAGAPAIAVTAPSSPYTRVALTLLPTMPEGDFDQLAADVGRNRLYVSAEDGATMDVFDLRTGALLRSGGDVGSPHKVAIDLRDNHILVADGADGSVKVLSPDLKTITRIPVGARPDTGVLDPAARIFYVSSRDGDGPNSLISAISLDSLKVVRTFTVPATTLKGLILDRQGHRLFVSMRDKDEIGIVHLGDGRVETWAAAGLHKNVPLMFDEKTNLLFAGSRDPAKLVVLDDRTGAVRATLPITDTSDSMSFDPIARILYVSGDSGMSSYRLGLDGSTALISTDADVVGKTSLYVPDLHRLYVMRPKKNDQVAALQIYMMK